MKVRELTIEEMIESLQILALYSPGCYPAWESCLVVDISSNLLSEEHRKRLEELGWKVKPTHASKDFQDH